MAKQYNMGDFVILIDDETPEENRNRLDKPRKKSKDNRKRKMGYFDEVDSINNNKVTTKIYNFKSKSIDGHDEDYNDALQRHARGEPTRRIYLMRREWFPQTHIRGLNYDIESVELDEDFFKNVVIPYQEN